jgi:hypothetical protein
MEFLRQRKIFIANGFSGSLLSLFWHLPPACFFKAALTGKKTSPLSQSAYAQKNASAQAGENAAAKPKNAGFADSGSISRKMDTSENEEEMSAAGSEDLAAM